MTDNVYIGNDSKNYYYDLLKNNHLYFPNGDDCNNINYEGYSCDNEKGFNDNSFNCIKKEICTNKILANNLNLEHTNNEIPKHDIQRYDDIKYSYHNYLLKNINLLFGICVIGFLIYYEKFKMNKIK